MLSHTGRLLVELMGQAPRGPRREGLFALWLTSRLVEDLDLNPPPSERSVRRRVALLERRLSSLTLAPPLRRALLGAIQAMKGETAPRPATLLGQLVVPVREALGAEAADAIYRGRGAGAGRGS